MDTTQTEALVSMVAVLGLFVLMILPAVIGIAHDRRIDRQIERAEAGRAAAGRRSRPSAARPARGAVPPRTTRTV
ncbi:hypothetical protein ABTY20_02525 [Streptomyces sp. NPDC126497]|uniref:hypothetical protein n=1 Tax=Streptomyces sp. NPDC126497 TaxID=3155313 RepID=UPI0033283CFA